MKIILPFPSRKLSPNYHAGWRAKEVERSAAYSHGYKAALIAKRSESFVYADEYQVNIAICPPDRRHRDIDNIHASLKHYIDGVCEILEINDRQFRKVSLTLGEVRKGGQVEMDIEPLEQTAGGEG